MRILGYSLTKQNDPPPALVPLSDKALAALDNRYVKVVAQSDAQGKALSDLADPAWELISGLPPWQFAGSVWRPYSAMDLEKAYRAHSLIHACIRLLSNSLCEAPLCATTIMGTEEKDIPNHPMLDLMNKPNPRHSRDDVLKYFIVRLLCVGRAYLWKWRYKTHSDIAQLWPIPSSWVREIPGAGDNLIDHYEVRQVAGVAINVPSEDMVRMAFIDPSTMLDCVSPLQAAQHDYQLDMERENYLVEMLTNLHVPGLKFKTTRKLGEKEKQELRASINDNAGPGRRGHAVFPELGTDMEMMEPLKDLDWPGLTELTESRICAAFGVPPIIIGARVGLNRSTYANYETARKSFYAETLKPLWKAIGDSLTRDLCASEGEEGVRLDFDLDDITALQEDASIRAKRATDLFNGGLFTRNQALVAAGQEPLDGPLGEMLRVPTNVEEIPANVTEADLIAEKAAKAEAAKQAAEQRMTALNNPGGKPPVKQGTVQE